MKCKEMALTYLAFAFGYKYIASVRELSASLLVMTSVDEAKKIVSESTEPVGTEVIPLGEAHHRVAASDILANDDIPPFDNSSMDGFAIRTTDAHKAHTNNPVVLQVVTEIAAGSISEKNLRPNTVAHVMTGAPIPEGADAVVEQELATVRNGSVLISSVVTEGRNIRRKGEDVRAGQTVVQKGTVLKAPHMGVLASIGISSLEVFRKPTVAILTSGNELIAVNSKLEPGKIRNSNAYSLLGLVKEAFCLPVDLAFVPDDEEILGQRIKEGLQHDALITSGGVSVGKYDLMLKALENVGVERKFWKVNIKPGGPVAFGVYARKGRKVPVFSLPGNSVSTMVTFLEFVLPGLNRLIGISSPSNRLQLKARLDHDIHKNDKKRHFNRGILRNEGGELFVRTTGSQSSGVLTSMVIANCLIVIPEDKHEVKAGEEVEVEIL